ncbi:phage holin family protein [Lysinibacillus sp. KU-BSD001]|uniref:phage holin family protein n=1 Tax=Lysinibacillus sp. KU-BSD001 TaxID=3141328 RepID=UPI0036E5987F
MEQLAKNIIAGITSVFTYFFGGWSILLTSLLILNVLDFALGILSSDEKINSKRLTQGGTKKGIMWMWILVANLVYMVLNHMGYDIGVSIANWVTLYFILTEVISLEENSAKLGSPIPTPVSFLINKLKDVVETKFKVEGDKK